MVSKKYIFAKIQVRLKAKDQKQGNTYADKIQTDFDPRNAERNLKDEIDLKSNFQNT